MIRKGILKNRGISLGFLLVALLGLSFVALVFAIGDSSVTVSTDSPQNDTGDYGTSITFTVRCNASDGTLVRAELHTNFSGGSLSYYEQNESAISNNTAFNFGTNASVSEGSYIWNVNCSDASGNWSFGEDKSIFVDKTTPTVKVYQPYNITYSNNSVPITYSIDEEHRNSTIIWQYNSNGTNYTASDNTTLLTFSVDGPQYLEVWNNDSAGNIGYNITYFNVDRNAPTVKVYQPHNTTYSNSSAPVSYSIDEANLNSTIIWQYNSNGTNYTTDNNTTSLIFSGSDGTKHLEVWNHDSIGKIGYNITYFTVDTTGPNISLISLSPSGNMTTRVNVTISVNFTDTIAGINESNLTAGVYKDGLSSYIANLSLNNSISGCAGGDIYCAVWDTTLTPADGVYWINVTASDLVGNPSKNSSFEFSNLNVTLASLPNMTIVNMTWNSSNLYNYLHPDSGDSIGINASIKNEGTGTASNINVSLYLDGSKILERTISSLAPSIISTISFNLSGGNFSSDADYNITVMADANNSITESFENNNSRTEVLAVGYNVTVLSISPSSPNPNQNVSLNISVKYANGDAVTGLSVMNFTVYDKKNGATLKTWVNGTLSWTGSPTMNKTWDDSRNSIGVYYFSISAYNATTNDATPRVHNVSVAVANGTYSGTNSPSDFYNLSVLNLTATFSGLQTSLEPSTADAFTVTIENNGLVTAYNLSAVLEVVGGDDAYLNSTNCTSSANQQLTAGQTYTCGAIFTPTTTGTFYIRLKTFTAKSASSSTAWLYTFSSLIKSAAIVVSTTSSSDDSSSSSSDSSDSSNTTTDSRENYDLNIYYFSDTVKIEQGKWKEVTVRVNNSGKYTLKNVKVSFDAPSSLEWTNWYSVSPVVQSTLSSSKVKTFTINISVPENASIESYSVKINAVSNKDSAEDTETFTLQVLPGPEAQAEINNTLPALKVKIDRVAKELQELMKKIRNENTTRANDTMADVNTLYMEALEAIANGDYLTAYDNQKSIENLLAEIEDIIMNEKEKTGGINWKLIAFSGVIIILVVVIYFWKSPEGGSYSLRSGYSFRSKKPIKKIKTPTVGFPRGKRTEYQYRKSKTGKIVSKVKNAVEKAKRKVTRK